MFVEHCNHYSESLYFILIILKPCLTITHPSSQVLCSFQVHFYCVYCHLPWVQPRQTENGSAWFLRCCFQKHVSAHCSPHPYLQALLQKKKKDPGIVLFQKGKQVKEMGVRFTLFLLWMDSARRYAVLILSMLMKELTNNISEILWKPLSQCCK